MDNDIIEKKIQEAGLTAPRVTPNDIEKVIVGADYHLFPGTNLTVCVITLLNGFTVTGESACVDPANFNEKIGREIAYESAKGKIWMLEGYLLKHKQFLLSKLEAKV